MMLNKFCEYDWCFFTMMGKYFAKKEIIKEMDCQLYSNKNMEWYILYNNINDVKGFVSIENKKSYFYIDNFYVIKSERNKGYSKKIFSKLMEDYNKNELKLITRNKKAKIIFENFGFKEYGKNGRYYKMIYKVGEL